MTSLSHVIISSWQKALKMKLANGVNEFFFKRISHVRPSLYPKISVTRMRTRRARFRWMARIFKSYG